MASAFLFLFKYMFLIFTVTLGLPALILLVAGYSSLLPQPYPPVAFWGVSGLLISGPVYTLYKDRRRQEGQPAELDDKCFGSKQEAAVAGWIALHTDPRGVKDEI